jgi:hypothetical protein
MFLELPLVSAQGGVTSGTMRLIFFPTDFPNARFHPLTRESYHAEGPGTLTVVFVAFEGTGVVTVAATSSAFTADVTASKAVTAALEPVLYALSFTVKPDLDGRFPVTITSKNESGEALSFDVEDLIVWSQDHIVAADHLLTARTLLGSLNRDLQSPGARAFRFEALEINARADSAYYRSNWTETSQLADEVLTRVQSAETAEAAFVNERLAQADSVEERRLVAEERQAAAADRQIDVQERSVALQEAALRAEQDARSAAVLRELSVAAALGFVVVGGAVTIGWLVRRKPTPHAGSGSTSA